MPNRCGHGFVWGNIPYDKNGHDWNNLINHGRFLEQIAMELIPIHLLRAIFQVKEYFDIPGMPTNENISTRIWSAMATAKNYYSAAHVDEYFFLSLLTVNVNNGKYPDFNSEIVTHFCIPYVGVAIAMRDGDCLIFNPQFHHCASQQESNLDGDVFLSIFYLKSKMIGENDNRVGLSQEQDEIIKKINIK